MDGTNTQQSDKKKKIIAIAILVLISIFIILGVLFYFRSRTTTPTPTEGTFPVGQNIDNTVPPVSDNTGGGTATGVQGGATTEQLAEIYKGPVAGYAALADGKNIILFDRQKGLLFTVDTETGNVTYGNDQPILRVHDATFLSDKAMIIRFLDNFGNIKSRLYQIGSGTNNATRYSLSDAIELPNNVLELGVSPDNKKFILVVKSASGSIIERYDMDSQNLQTVIKLPISEWIPYITDSGDMFLVAKASTYAKSGAYKIVGDKLVMATQADTEQTALPSPDGKLILSQTLSKTGFPVINPSDIAAIADGSIPLKFFTIADKCTWEGLNPVVYCAVPTNNSLNLDDWYMGKAKSADVIMRQVSGEDDPIMVSDTTFTLKQIDAIKLSYTPNALFLINKRDEHLWKIKLVAPPPVETMATGTVVQTNN